MVSPKKEVLSSGAQSSLLLCLSPGVWVWLSHSQAEEGFLVIITVKSSLLRLQLSVLTSRKDSRCITRCKKLAVSRSSCAGSRRTQWQPPPPSPRVFVGDRKKNWSWEKEWVQLITHCHCCNYREGIKVQAFSSISSPLAEAGTSTNTPCEFQCRSEWPVCQHCQYLSP